MVTGLFREKILLLFRVFLPFAFGYALSYLYRVVNAVIADDLILELELTAEDLGLLTGAYFLTFAACQIPLGLALDRVGARRSEAFLLLFAAIGAAVFAFGDTLTDLALGRALIGVGVSACLMAAFKAYITWFPRERLPMINGLQMAAGGLGAVMATTPVESLLTVTDWRHLFMFLAALTILASALVFFIVPERQAEHGNPAPVPIWSGFRTIYSSGLFWRVAIPTVFSQATFLAIQGLWAGPWLRDVCGMSPSEAAVGLTLIACAMIAGFASLGWLATHASRWGGTPFHVAFGAMACFILVQTCFVLEWVPSAYALWALFGFFGTAGILPYAALSQRFPYEVAGRLNTGLNVLVFVAAFCAQWGIGAVIDLWPRNASGFYASAGYQAAFALLLGLQVAALIGAILYRHRDTPVG